MNSHGERTRMIRILIECFIAKESAPVFSLGLARGLLASGVDVSVCTISTIENREDWEKLLGEDHLHFINEPWSILKHPTNTIGELIKIKKKFGTNHFDYVIDTFPKGRSHTIAKVLSFDESIGIAHDVIPHSGTPIHEVKKKERAMRKYNNVIVLSRLFFQEAKRRYKLNNHNIFYLRHGVMDYPKMTVPQQNNYEINFLFFGRISEYKGLSVLANAYKRIASEYDNVSLTVAGGGDFTKYYSKYQGMERCNVINKYISSTEVAALFEIPKTVVVLPYLDASQSGVIGIALSYGAPIIASDTGGLKEQLFDGLAGVYAEPGDTDDLYKKMKLFIDDKELYYYQKELIMECYEKSTWESVSKELVSKLVLHRQGKEND